MSAKKVVIDWDKVDTFLRAQCSGIGISSILGIHVNTLYTRCREDKGVEFSEYSQQKKGEGKELLRAKQFKMAYEGNTTMAIWLGKQYLEQKDKSDHSSTDGTMATNKVDVFKQIRENAGINEANQ